MKSFNIIVKDTSQLTKYGFVKNKGDCYDLRTPQGICLWLRVERNKLMIISASTPSIKVLCEMYKDGVIAFEEYKHKKVYMLTDDEAELLRKYRENKN